MKQWLSQDPGCKQPPKTTTNFPHTEGHVQNLTEESIDHVPVIEDRFTHLERRLQQLE